jgi:hypothetical protein
VESSSAPCFFATSGTSFSSASPKDRDHLLFAQQSQALVDHDKGGSCWRASRFSVGYEQVKGRPLYLVQDRVNFGANTPSHQRVDHSADAGAVG